MAGLPRQAQRGKYLPVDRMYVRYASPKRSSSICSSFGALTNTPTGPRKANTRNRTFAVSRASPSPHEWELEYTPLIKLERKRSPSGGGCG